MRRTRRRVIDWSTLRIKVSMSRWLEYYVASSDYRASVRWFGGARCVHQ
jgi:hypothetical protein